MRRGSGCRWAGSAQGRSGPGRNAPVTATDPGGPERRVRALRVFAFLLAALPLAGCLYSTHNFATGRLLPQGRSEATVGFGRQPIWRCAGYVQDSTRAGEACGEGGGGEESAERSDMPKGSVGYRLGMRDAWGPFPGLELRWHLEAPTNPATMEFGLNLGLPGGARDSAGAFRHAVGAGWGIGAWADKTFYAEYAASARVGPPLLFSNLRVTYLATQIGEVLGEDFAKPFPSNQHWVFQAGLGAGIPVGDWLVLPDIVIPGVSITLPQIPSGEREFQPSDIPLLQWDATLGLGWTF
jgi:hypothetical protein